jgi:dihydroorotate dehydrogenase electron transfer subunit
MTIARPPEVAFRPLGTDHGGRVADRACTVIGVEPVASEYRRLRFEAWPELASCRPGQFVMLRPLTARLIRRPFTVFDADADRGRAEVVFRVTGEGTARLAGLRPGDRLSVLGPLGNGFHLEPGRRRAMLVGRGVGMASLHRLARHCLALGLPTQVLISARRPDLWLAADELREDGAEVLGVDDLSGTSRLGAVERLLEPAFARPGSQCFACGSSRLIRLVARLGARWQVPVQVALEAPMACGIGTCHACPLRPGLETEGHLVCVDGPVFATGGERVA